ncbi:MAG: permease prefix domain 1-containing protein [Clostridia bacterium]|nr:permease prefix domain 1-containing protein [Clostridia bacterium]
MFELESNIRAWSDNLRSGGNLKETDILELESHLRDEIEDLTKAGLSEDEAFLISLKRLGSINKLSSEYSKVNTEKMWKNLFSASIDPEIKKKTRKDIFLVIIFSILSGTMAKIPELFGYHMFSPGSELFFLKNLGFFILPFIVGFFAIRHNLNRKLVSIIIGIFIISAVTINFYPSFAPKNTELLTGIHLPMFLWLITGVAYIGEKWRSSKGRMDFIRFTGESVIYGGLTLAGIVVLSGFTLVLFSAIQIDLSKFVPEYFLVYGGCAAAMITVFLVESKRSIVENFAPVLAKIFSPLFLIIMTAFLLSMIVLGRSPFMDRDFLIQFDLMLVLVLGLVLYVISARDKQSAPNIFDYLNLSLIIVALIIDGIALSAILFRLSSFGITPNKVAALGENIALLVNLGGLALLYIRYFAKKIEFSILERWQTFYLYFYAAWIAVVAFVFPIIFSFK